MPLCASASLWVRSLCAPLLLSGPLLCVVSFTALPCLSLSAYLCACVCVCALGISLVANKNWNRIISSWRYTGFTTFGVLTCGIPLKMTLFWEKGCHVDSSMIKGQGHHRCTGNRIDIYPEEAPGSQGVIHKLTVYYFLHVLACPALPSPALCCAVLCCSLEPFCMPYPAFSALPMPFLLFSALAALRSHYWPFDLT